MVNNNSDLESIKALIAQFHGKIAAYTQVALNCPKGGNEAWFELIKKYNIEPVPENQKTLYYSQGVPITKGAFPSELRKLYQSLRYEVIYTFRQNFSIDKLSFEAADVWDDFIRYLERFIEEAINKYIGDIKQKVGVSDIFANAFSGMNKYSVGLKGSDLNTKQCKSCGSPRLDTDQYGECYFCGTLLFETTEREAKCKKCGSPKFVEDQGKACRYCGN
jgi:hypothetical protein